MGYRALYSNISGTNNTAVGTDALFNSSGNDNTAVGSLALNNNNGGIGVTAVGSNAGTNIPAGMTNFTAIGFNTGRFFSISNSVEIGNSSVTWIGGNTFWSTYSDGRIKENIMEDVPGLAFISKLRPVSYNLNIHKQDEMMYGDKLDRREWAGRYDIEKRRISGFVAQEVEQAATKCGYDFHGVMKPNNPNGLYSLSYSEFVVPLVKAVQELNTQNEEMKQELERLKAQVEELRKMIAK
jgi:hypothetical protein